MRGFLRFGLWGPAAMTVSAYLYPMSAENRRQERLTPAQAKERVKQWCAGSERCQSEVRSRLFGYGLNSREADEIIAGLIEESYLDEERYARQYAGGHFRMKQWGRVKILHGLRAKGISEYCIKKGLKEIEEGAYEAVLKKHAAQKWNSTRGRTPAVRWAQTRQYLLQKGFESHLVLQALRQVSGTQAAED